MPPQPVTETNGTTDTSRPPSSGTGGAIAWPQDTTAIAAQPPQPQQASPEQASLQQLRPPAHTVQSTATAAGRAAPEQSVTTHADVYAQADASHSATHSTPEDSLSPTDALLYPPDETLCPTDEMLMNALCQGDDNALAPLMQRWELPVKGFLLRLGVAAADVEDIAQEAFVRLYLKRAAYRQGSAFRPWLLTLAANLGRNRLRWRLRRRESSIDTIFEPAGTADGSTTGASLPGDSAPLPSAAADLSQRRRAVRKVIASLPAKLRSAVVCVDLEGLSHAEAAQILDCTPKAVENRLRRARERIRTGCAAWMAEESL